MLGRYENFKTVEQVEMQFDMTSVEVTNKLKIVVSSSDE